jgi:hypothetical protein
MIDLDKEVQRISQLPDEERLLALKRIIPRKTVQAVLRKVGRRQRHCRRLPGWFMVWFVIGLGFYGRDSYCQVFRWLQAHNRVPQRSTLCEARQSLGVAAFRLLWNEVVRLLADVSTPGAFYRDMRLMALDGFVVDLPDRPDLARIFGRPQSGRAAGAFPQARVLALCETGTHVIWRHLVKPIRCGEVTMASTLLRCLEKNMLLMWDRGFLSYATVAQVVGRQAFLLARIKKNLIFTPLRRFCDGSFLAKVYPSCRHRAQDQDGIPVRIIEYTFKDRNRPGAGEKHRLLTTLLHPSVDPAKRLIELYHQRWELELAIDELKTHQRERPVLRSETPAGVIQEIHGLLLAHYVVRVLMFEAAEPEGIDPRRLSFTGTLKILRCRLPQCPKSAKGLAKWYKDLLAEIATEKLPERRDRINPRVIKRKMSRWPKKRPKHGDYPQPKQKFRQTIVMLN